MAPTHPLTHTHALALLSLLAHIFSPTLAHTLPRTHSPTPPLSPSQALPASAPRRPSSCVCVRQWRRVPSRAPLALTRPPVRPHRVPAYACSCKHPSLTHLHGTSPVILPKKIHAPRHAPEPIRVDASWTLCPHRVSGSIIVAGIVARINAPFHTTARAISPPPSHHDHRHGARHGGGLRSRHMGLQSTLCQRGCPCNPASQPCLATLPRNPASQPCFTTLPRLASERFSGRSGNVQLGMARHRRHGNVRLGMASHG